MIAQGAANIAQGSVSPTERSSVLALSSDRARQNSWRWRPILKRWGHLRMLINSDYLKTCTFLIDEGEPVGTVFFVTVKFGTDGALLGGRQGPSFIAYYAITASHVVAGPKREMALRFNLKQGETRDEPVSSTDWILHDSTDIAILTLHMPLGDFDVGFLRYNSFIKQSGHLFKRGLDSSPDTPLFPYGAGTEIYSIGLFAKHAGSSRARPLARFGHIALDPAHGEQILAQLDATSSDYMPIDAILVEMASWQGQSGSPVFMRPLATVDESAGNRDPDVFGASFLLGLMQGSYSEIEEVLFSSSGEPMGYKANAGIASVVPAKDILNMIENNEVLVGERKRLAAETLQQQPAKQRGPRSVRVVGQTQPENELTRDTFEQVLKRASRKQTNEEKAKGDNE